MPGAPPSPYGGTPGPFPAPNRTPLFIVLGGLGAAAIAALLFFVLTDDDGGGQAGPNPTEDTQPPEGSQPDDTEPDDTEPSPGAAWDGTPSSGGSTESVDLGDGLVLAEYGFSNVASVYDESELKSSWGFVIENTGSERIEQVSLSITLYDTNDAVIDSLTQTVYVLEPGEKIGIGGLSFDATAPLGDMDIQSAGPSERYGDPIGDGGLTVSNVAATASDSGDQTSVTFDVDSSYDTDTDTPRSYVIFRNAEGQIIGGYQGYDLGYLPAGGSTSTKIDTYVVYDSVDIDLEQTEAYVDFGP